MKKSDRERKKLANECMTFSRFTNRLAETRSYEQVEQGSETPKSI